MHQLGWLRATPSYADLPFCDEGVRWFVLGTPISASASQIGAFTDFIHDNARPTQPLNDRSLG